MQGPGFEPRISEKKKKNTIHNLSPWMTVGGHKKQ